MFFRAFLTKRHIFTQTKKFFGQTCDIIKLRQQGRGPDHPHEPANRRTKGGPPCKTGSSSSISTEPFIRTASFTAAICGRLLPGTWAEPLERTLSAGRGHLRRAGLDMNRFYRRGHAEAATVPELVQALRKRVLPNMTYAEALQADDVVYLGDAWAVLAYLGDALGCLDGDRANEVYRLTRLQMERAGMHGDRGLYEAIMRLEQRCRVVLLSNSYEETVREFLRQLGFAGAFREICSSANKPYGMIASLQALDPALLARPEALISIGDHAFNDLMPISAIGGRRSGSTLIRASTSRNIPGVSTRLRSLPHFWTPFPEQ